MAARRASNGRCYECHKISSREHYENNSEKYKQKSREWAKKNPAKAAKRSPEAAERNKQRSLARYYQNKHFFKAYKQTRRARKKEAGGRHTPLQLKGLMEHQRGRCATCRANIRKSYHADHIQPLSRGGSNHIHNIQLLCPPCNRRKHSKTPEAWALENGRLL